MGHTPGPWEAHGWGDAEVEIVGPNDRVICELAQEYDEHSGAGTNAAIEDDARLIAAAPELLATMRFILPVLEDAARRGTIDSDGVNLELEAAREVASAIAKAEGRSE